MSEHPANKNSSPTKTSLAKATTLVACGAIAAAIALPLAPFATNTVLADAVHIEAPQVAGFANVVAAVQPAVVSVRVEAKVEATSDNPSHRFGRGFGGFPDDHPLAPFFDRFGPEWEKPFRKFFERDDDDHQRGNKRRRPRNFGMSQGSGFFVSDDGYLVTNYHVIRNGAKFTVILDDGTEYQADLVGSDPRTDLAVLKIKADREFVYVDFADAKSVRIGDWVVAVGNPFGLGGTVTAGIVSARGREINSSSYGDFIQIDAAVNRGNSGGPAFNLSGEVIGINTAIFTPSGGNVGIAFAIPSDTAEDIVMDLIDDGTVVRGWLGVQIQPIDEEIAESLGLESAQGAIVTEPQDGSPAKKAGIKSGDVIIAVDGNTIKGPKELANTIGDLPPEAEATISVWRNGKVIEFSVELGKLAETQAKTPAAPAKSSLADYGLELESADNGVTIVKVEAGSPADDKGLRAGDTIVTVGGNAVSTPLDVRKALETVKETGRKSALLQVRRGDNSRFVALAINASRG